MSVIQTYDSLVLNVQQYMERNDADFIAQIPNLIALAESSIAAELKTYLQLIVVETSLAQNQTVLNKPSRWRKTVSMKTNGVPMLLRSQDYVAQYLSESDPGQPKYYAEYDYNNWIVAPTPDQAYPFEVLVYQLLPLLDDANQSNWLTQYAPQVLLYASLLEATPFLKNDERIQVWQQMYDRAAQALNGEDLSKILDRSARRTEA